jgi:cytochrome c-type biogenesis protein CcmF
VLGACVETAGKRETAAVLTPGEQLVVGGRTLTLQAVEPVEGPNYAAERARLVAVDGRGRRLCEAAPERRLYPASMQTTSEVALCGTGASDLYVVLGERRPTPEGHGWLVRAYWNPLAKLIFLGPALIALGGLVSLSDRRLRLAAPVRTRRALKPAPVPAE